LHHDLIPGPPLTRSGPSSRRRRKVTEVFEIVPVDGVIIGQALASGMRDFEDAVQAFAGRGSGATHVVSRDATGLVDGPLPVLTPEQFLAAVGALGQQSSR
jgi:hypothetical protein